MDARRALVRLVTIAAIAAVIAPPTTVLASQRDRLRVAVYVIDFDPPTADGTPLTTAHDWADPAVLDAAYGADVGAASGGIVDLRVSRETTVRSYPAKPGGFVFTTAQYDACLLNGGGGRCPDLIDYASVLGTAYDARFGSACEAVRRGRIDEVWLWGGPWFGYLEQLPVAPRTLCPSVDRTFVVMGFNYERGEAEMLHDLGHRAEGLVQPAIGFGLWDRFDGQRGRYAQDFACPAAPDATHPEVDPAVTHAGNVHFPPNAYCHYQYDRPYQVMSDADDWLRFPDLTGELRPLDSTAWGATQQGFMMWWLGHLPRSHGTWQGISTDWWLYVFPTAHGRPSI